MAYNPVNKYKTSSEAVENLVSFFNKKIFELQQKYPFKKPTASSSSSTITHTAIASSSGVSSSSATIPVINHRTNPPFATPSSSSSQPTPSSSSIPLKPQQVTDKSPTPSAGELRQQRIQKTFGKMFENPLSILNEKESTNKAKEHSDIASKPPKLSNQLNTPILNDLRAEAVKWHKYLYEKPTRGTKELQDFFNTVISWFAHRNFPNEAFSLIKNAIVQKILSLDVYNCIPAKDLKDEKLLSDKSRHKVYIANYMGKPVVLKRIESTKDKIQIPVENFAAHVKALFDRTHTTIPCYVMEEDGEITGVAADFLEKLTTYAKMSEDQSADAIQKSIAELVKGGLADFLVTTALCQDGDPHKSNIALTGSNNNRVCTAFDHGQSFVPALIKYGIASRISQNPFWSNKIDFFLLTVREINHFPNTCREYGGSFYHPTRSQVFGKPENKYSEADAHAFQNLQYNSEFIKQGYFRFFMSIFVTAEMLSKCAEETVPDNDLSSELSTTAKISFQNAKTALKNSHRFRKVFLANFEAWVARAKEEFGKNTYYQRLCNLGEHPTLNDFIDYTAESFRKICDEEETLYYKPKPEKDYTDKTLDNIQPKIKSLNDMLVKFKKSSASLNLENISLAIEKVFSPFNYETIEQDLEKLLPGLKIIYPETLEILEKLGLGNEEFNKFFRKSKKIFLQCCVIDHATSKINLAFAELQSIANDEIKSSTLPEYIDKLNKMLRERTGSILTNLFTQSMERSNSAPPLTPRPSVYTHRQ